MKEEYQEMLSKKTKYAFQALIFLAKQKEGPVLISTIASETTIPKKFLENILLELKKAGILNSKMGKGGGYYLMKEAKNVSMAKIMRMFHGPIAFLPCVSLNYYEPCEECINEEECGLRSAFIEVRDKCLEIFEGKNLADLVKNPNI